MCSMIILLRCEMTMMARGLICGLSSSTTRVTFARLTGLVVVQGPGTRYISRLHSSIVAAYYWSGEGYSIESDVVWCKYSIGSDSCAIVALTQLSSLNRGWLPHQQPADRRTYYMRYCLGELNKMAGLPQRMCRVSPAATFFATVEEKSPWRGCGWCVGVGLFRRRRFLFCSHLFIPFRNSGGFNTRFSHNKVIFGVGKKFM